MLKGTITAFGLMMSMSLFSYSFSQDTTFESVKNNQCAWNEQTQIKDLCTEVANDVQIEINVNENRVSITTDGYISEYKIENWVNSGGIIQNYNLISADGTSWKMAVHLTNNEIWLDMENNQYTDSITYTILN